jgi:hypothetical protein
MIESYESDCILFVSCYDDNVVTSFISEHSITEAFIDFFDSLKHNKFVYSKEETVNILNLYINQLLLL